MILYHMVKGPQSASKNPFPTRTAAWLMWQIRNCLCGDKTTHPCELLLTGPPGQPPRPTDSGHKLNFTFLQPRLFNEKTPVSNLSITSFLVKGFCFLILNTRARTFEKFWICFSFFKYSAVQLTRCIIYIVINKTFF